MNNNSNEESKRPVVLYSNTASIETNLLLHSDVKINISATVFDRTCISRDVTTAIVTCNHPDELHLGAFKHKGAKRKPRHTTHKLPDMYTIDLYERYPNGVLIKSLNFSTINKLRIKITALIKINDKNKGRL